MTGQTYYVKLKNERDIVPILCQRLRGAGLNTEGVGYHCLDTDIEFVVVGVDEETLHRVNQRNLWGR